MCVSQSVSQSVQVGGEPYCVGGALTLLVENTNCVDRES